MYILPQNAYSFSLDFRNLQQPSSRNIKLVPEGIINGNPVIVRGTGQKLYIVQINGTATSDRELRFGVTIPFPSNLTKENFRVVLSSDPSVSEDDVRRFPLVANINYEGEYETSVIYTYSPYYPRPLFFIVVESQLPPGMESRIIFHYEVLDYVDYGDFESVIFPILIICGLLILLVMASACFWGMVKRMRDRARIVSEQMEMEAKTLIELNRHHQQRTPIANHVHVRQERDNRVLNTIDPPKQDEMNMRPEGIVEKQIPIKSQQVELHADSDAVTYVRLNRPPIQEEIHLAQQQPIPLPNEESNADTQNHVLIPPPIFNPTPVPGFPGLYATTTTTTTVLLPQVTEPTLPTSAEVDSDSSESNDH